MELEKFIEKYSVDRMGTYATKWQGMTEMYGREDLLPLWIADMDFKVCDSVQAALQERVDHGVYGYTYLWPEYLEAYQAWMQTYYGVQVEGDWIRFANGVVQGIYYLLHAFTQPDDSVAILTPVYYPYHDLVRETGRRLITVPLTRDDQGFSLNMALFEQAILDAKVKAFILCSPHNPVGRVWTEEELVAMFKICKRHDVFIIADEIHQDFAYGDHQHHCALTVASGQFQDRLAVLNSTSKSFNLAGFPHSHILLANDDLRAHYDAYAAGQVRTPLNVMSAIATCAAYQGGHAWLNTVKEVILHNYATMKDRLQAAHPEIWVAPLEGTYLMFIDLEPVLGDQTIEHFMEECVGCAVDYGHWFGVGYERFIRVNLATDPKYIQEATDRILAAIESSK